MKKIINGKMYDTDTAKKVGEWSNGCGYRDFAYCEEELYLKKTGEFFLYGWGGANSKYAERCGQNCWRNGEAINPLTEKQVKQWVETHLDTDEYIAIFGEVEE